MKTIFPAAALSAPDADLLHRTIEQNKTARLHLVLTTRTLPDDEANDVATASLLENYIDATEKRTWFLFEASRKADGSGH